MLHAASIGANCARSPRSLLCSDSNDCVVVEPISSPLRLDTPAGRIQIVHSVLNIVRLLADYYINLPVIPVALGQRTVKWHPDGSKRSDVTFFSGDHTETSCSAVIRQHLAQSGILCKVLSNLVAAGA